MSVETVKNYLKQWNKDKDILEFETSSATVELAAEALDVVPGRIAKSISFAKENGCILIVAAGDTKIDNSKYKHTFGIKSKMLKPDEVVAFTGHQIGGVCPFAIDSNKTDIYLDESLKRFDVVYPAAGSSNSCIGLNLDELSEYSKAKGWVDVCK